MPEIRFTREEELLIEDALADIDRVFDARFDWFRQWLSEEDHAAIRQEVRDQNRRYVATWIGLRSLAETIADRPGGSPEAIEAFMREAMNGVWELEDRASSAKPRVEVS